MWAENITKSYSNKKEEAAIQSVSFHVLKGKTIALLDENGAGKTTLLSLFARKITPDSGRLYHSKPEGEIKIASVGSLSLPPSFCSVSHFAKIMQLYHRIPNPGNLRSYQLISLEI